MGKGNERKKREGEGKVWGRKREVRRGEMKDEKGRIGEGKKLERREWCERTIISSFVRKITSGQSNLTKKPHRHRIWMVVPILYNGPSFSQKLPLPMGDLGPHLIHGSLGPPESIPPNRISIGSAVFARIMIMTDRQSDRPTQHASKSVTIGRIYVLL